MTTPTSSGASSATAAVSGGVVHELPDDLRAAVLGGPRGDGDDGSPSVSRSVLGLWEDITPLARNEFICWVEDAKQPATRTRRVRRTCEELEEGKRRPCCWPGCKHR
ncbi:YdeI/OmpD-associated family protein [Corynebacterium glyciniphilum]|uniref:YdeI/OmpD-associated family protein n=1 Tax=Corynebacterium glyciniphilum TaxID=1404244 RepID=UPI00264B55B6|nr:YdeI/OmpD-associated family protein [Corynebacterium glyciniphilum]MDN5684164.1 YdeI/OmpD-associated family protein [Corynebacterium glyciniphilum]